MKCPKCGYHSFDHLDSCKKCGQGLSEHKAKFNLRSFFFPGQARVAEPATAIVDSSREQPFAEDGATDFGFDFFDEETAPIGTPDGSDRPDALTQAVNIDQPFAADGETVPADDQAGNTSDKPGKGPEFAF